ncbi:hypothetical protein RIR_e46969_A0A2N1MQH3_9GLOM [Rhizophagus irregularis DAOM 181602=DAOM 197198]|nr:hypothetical protein RIR_e46969_A0A2N1MQH3_9GLOM [Rhizophagus irregularis DAOM 181602=DAOM 197198]
MSNIYWLSCEINYISSYFTVGFNDTLLVVLLICANNSIS